MDVTWLYAALGVLLVLAFKLFTRGPRRNLPPSPPAIPVIGHLHLVKQPPHRTMHNLSQKYGPIFSLRFGSRMVLVVSSPAAVEECFTKNDITFANRPPFLIGKYIGYNHTTMVASPYGEHWRNLRRLSALEIFSASRLNSFISIRKDEVRLLVESLYKSSPSGFGRVELRPGLTELTFNNMTRMVAGKRYYGHDSMEDYEEAKKVRWLISEVFKLGGTTYPEDYLPFLKRLGYMKLENKLAEVTEKMDVFFQGLIDEHRRQRGTRNSMIEHLLNLQESQPEYYTDLIIKGLILNMLIAGTDTSAVTVEWAMSFLLNNPESLKKVRAELDAVVGQDRLMEESDISKVPYLQHIISETLRLCPPAPLLVPHMASKDCTVGGYDVPAGTVLLPNAWTIQRDPSVWEDPESFKPERFQGVEYEAHKLLPFGMGRRICPGASLAQRIVGLTLGSLIQCFDWERPSEQLVDLTEGFGLTMPKAEPLEAMCKARDIVTKLF